MISFHVFQEFFFVFKPSNFVSSQTTFNFCPCKLCTFHPISESENEASYFFLFKSFSSGCTKEHMARMHGGERPILEGNKCKQHRGTTTFCTIYQFLGRECFSDQKNLFMDHKKGDTIFASPRSILGMRI